MGLPVPSSPFREPSELLPTRRDDQMSQGAPAVTPMIAWAPELGPNSRKARACILLSGAEVLSWNYVRLVCPDGAGTLASGKKFSLYIRQEPLKKYLSGPLKPRRGFA